LINFEKFQQLYLIIAHKTLDAHDFMKAVIVASDELVRISFALVYVGPGAMMVAPLFLVQRAGFEPANPFGKGS
jgi:hypothetical protein